MTPSTTSSSQLQLDEDYRNENVSILGSTKNVSFCSNKKARRLMSVAFIIIIGLCVIIKLAIKGNHPTIDYAKAVEVFEKNSLLLNNKYEHLARTSAAHHVQKSSGSQKLERGGKQLDIYTNNDEKLEYTDLKNLLFENKLRPRRFNRNKWVKTDEKNGSTDSDKWIETHGQGSFVYQDVESKKITKIVASKTILNRIEKRYGHIFHKEISPNGKYLLLTIDSQKVFRYSKLSRYVIISLSEGFFREIVIPTTNQNSSPDIHGRSSTYYHRLVQFTNFDDGLLIVNKNRNIYYQPRCFPRNERDSNEIMEITQSGNETNRIHNGIPDWVFEEDILSSDRGAMDTNKLDVDVVEENRDDNQRRLLAFTEFDDNDVHMYKIPVYGSWHDLTFGGDDFENNYPSFQNVSYPKAGTNNPKVTLWITDLAHPNPMKIRIPPPSTPHFNVDAATAVDEPFVYRFQFVSNSSLLAVTWMNRIQNHVVLSICSFQYLQDNISSVSSEEGQETRSPEIQTNCQVMFERQVDDGWLEDVFFLFSDVTENDSRSYTPPSPSDESLWSKYSFYALTIAPDMQTDHDLLRRQILKIEFPSGKKTFMTNQDSTTVVEVVEILHHQQLRDEERVCIYYTVADTPISQSIYRLTSRRDGSERMIECISCKVASDTKRIITLADRKCSYFDMSMNARGTYFATSCLGPSVPFTVIYKVEIDRDVAPIQLISVYDDNDDVAELLHNLNQHHVLPKSEFLSLSVPFTVEKWKMRMKVDIEISQKVQIKIQYPPNFNPQTKYPTLFYVYGGPGTNSVTSKYTIGSPLSTYLTSQKEWIYVEIDPVGAGRQGDRWRYMMYKSFGTVEVDSLLETITNLQTNYSYIDVSRSVLWGWSYGGYFTISTLLKQLNTQQRETTQVSNLSRQGGESPPLKCGVAVAPVTDWRLYDTYYTERYMRKPKENLGGYNQSSVFNYDMSSLTENGVRLFLAHGSRDDNVHLQNSMLLSEALQDANVLFTQHIFVDQTHGISDYIFHLYRSIVDFIENKCR